MVHKLNTQQNYELTASDKTSAETHTHVHYTRDTPNTRHT